MFTTFLSPFAGPKTTVCTIKSHESYIQHFMGEKPSGPESILVSTIRKIHVRAYTISKHFRKEGEKGRGTCFNDLSGIDAPGCKVIKILETTATALTLSHSNKASSVARVTY